MKQFASSRPLASWFLALLALALVQCTTLDYRNVQTDFEKAAMAEDGGADSVFVDRYQTVRATLTDGYIMRLDPKLQSNALMLRAVSEWRIGDWTAARQTATKGQSKKPAPGSRDQVVLAMIDGMAAGSEVLAMKGKRDGKITAKAYQADYQPVLENGWTSLVEAGDLFTGVTPTSVKDYWHFQRWKLLSIWHDTCTDIGVVGNAADTEARRETQSAALKFIGAASFKEAKNEEARSVSENSPYRSRM